MSLVNCWYPSGTCFLAVFVVLREAGTNFEGVGINMAAGFLKYARLVAELMKEPAVLEPAVLDPSEIEASSHLHPNDESASG